MAVSSTHCVLIGPSAHRYKGGVAQFSDRLAAELRKRCRLTFFSWSRLYPPFLASRECSPEELAEAALIESQPEFLLNYLNPVSWLRCLFKIRAINPEYIFLTWIHPVTAPVYLALLAGLKLFSRARIVFICHNLMPHERFPAAKWLTRLCLRQGDRVVLHSSALQTEAAELCRDPAAVLPLFLPLHDFFSSSPESGTPWSAPRPLNILFFGTIRSYKGVDILLRALPLVRKHYPQLHLTIAGEVFCNTARVSLKRRDSQTELEELIKDLSLQECVTLRPGYIPDSEVPRLFSSADLAVFPFRSVSQSGSLTLAYAHKKPVVCSAIGGFLDCVVEGVSGYFAQPEDPQSLADAVLTFIRSPIAPQGVEQVAKSLSWDVYTSKLLSSCQGT